MDYHARFCSPSLGRFTQPDTIIPNLVDTQNWNRYTYTVNNPVNYNDPSCHTISSGDGWDLGDYLVGNPGLSSRMDEPGTYPQPSSPTGNSPSSGGTGNSGNGNSGGSRNGGGGNKSAENDLDGTRSNEPTSGKGDLASPPPPDDDGELSDAYLVAMGIGAVIIDIGLIAAELGLLALAVASFVYFGPVVGSLVELVLCPAELLIGDVAVSTALYTYETIQTGSKPEFKLTLIPSIIDGIKSFFSN